MIRVFFTLATLAVIGGSTAASCVTRQRAVVVQQVAVVVQKEVVAAVVAPVAVYTPVAVPVYSAVYAQPLYAPAPAPPANGSSGQAVQMPASDVQAILSAIQSIDNRIKVLEKVITPLPPAPAPKPKEDDPFNPKPVTAPPPATAPATAPPPPPAKEPVSAAIKSAHPYGKCASCHEQAVAATKGGDFRLLDGDAAVKLNDRQARRVLSMAYTGRMPPKNAKIALTDAEVAAIVAYLDDVK